MADFSWRDLSRVVWWPTLKLALMRGFASSVVLTPFVFFSQQAQGFNPEPGGMLIFFIVWIFYSFIGVPIVFFTLKGVAAILNPFTGGTMGAIIGFGLLLISIMVACGDPILFVLGKMFPGLLPVREFGFFNLKTLLFALRDETNDQSQADLNDHRAQRDRTAVDEPSDTQVGGRDPEYDSAALLNRARSGGGFARIAVIAILVVAVSGGAFYLWQSSQRSVPANAVLDPNHFEVLPYSAQQAIVAREGELNIRALPFARPDVLILRETAAGEVLNVTGLVNQAEGPWYQVRLTDGRTGYLKASLAISQSDYISSAAAGPPLTDGVYVQQGVCPFEGCEYRRWRATRTTTMYASPDASASSVGEVGVGEWVNAQTGEVHIVPVRGGAVRASGNVAVGDVGFRLSYLGEGNWSVWHNGRVIEDSSAFEFPNDNGDRGIWWVRVTDAIGREGWIRDANNFACRGIYGGDEDCPT